jgi:serine/threonine protein kinase
MTDDSDATTGRPGVPAAIPSLTLPLGTRLDQFEITGLIGKGGFGIVYLAFDHILQRRVAIKEYLPTSLATRAGEKTVSVRSPQDAATFASGMHSFMNEARLLASFDHPSLLKVYQFWEANGTAYMVMPLYEGATLKQLLQSRDPQAVDGPTDEAWLKGLLHPLLDALEHLHAAQCYHRDIAPDNILIQTDGRPLLLDFGAARRVISDMTHTLTVILKPGYAPIEQYGALPGSQQGPWTDIYALAAVVYCAVTGKVPTPSITRIVSDPLEPASRVAAGRYSSAFLAGIDKALSVRPEGRPQNVSELRALWRLDTPTKRIDDTTTLPSATRLRLWAIGAMAALTLIATLASLRYFATSTSRSVPDQAQQEQPKAPAVAAPELDIAAPIERIEPAPTVEAPSAITPPARAARDASATRPPPPKADDRAPADSTPPPGVCTELLQRASVGETLTTTELETLMKSCK